MNRCNWCGKDELYIKYHDEEWGLPVFDDKKQFEFLVLESAQAGLSWITILRKRESYKKAYDNFDPLSVASFDEEKVQELMGNEGIIRNERKIRASINNAQRFLELQKEFGSFCNYIWRFINYKPVINCWSNESEIPAKTELSEEISKDMKRRGFKFLGPVIIYSHLQATGLVNDHIKDCFRYDQVAGMDNCQASLNLNTYEIKDNCRKNLNKYTMKAFSSIPQIENPLILDMGCGTGVPTLALAENCNGSIYAVDSDNSCLLWLKEKVNSLNYSERITVIHASVFDTDLFSKKFDIVLAEGLLNVIGFEKGLSILVEYLKHNGYLIIHDELHNAAEKKKIFEKYNLGLINSFELDENVWWNDYYRCLEKSIENIDNGLLFDKEVNEIIEFKKDSKQFSSAYYVLQKCGEKNNDFY